MVLDVTPSGTEVVVVDMRSSTSPWALNPGGESERAPMLHENVGAKLEDEASA